MLLAKVFLLGGEDITKRRENNTHKQALEEAGSNLSILIFPWTFEIEDSKFRSIMSDHFTEQTDLGESEILGYRVIITLEQYS